jgi:hypothetical protein
MHLVLLAALQQVTVLVAQIKINISDSMKSQKINVHAKIITMMMERV